MPRLRGNGLVNIVHWVIEHHGEAEWAALRGSLAPADRALLLDLRASGWYPLALQARLLRAIDQRHGDADLRLARSIGSYQATRDLEREVITWLFRLFPPSTLVGNMDIVWRRFHDSGRWASRVEGPATVMTLHDWHSDDAANCVDVEGYLEVLGRRMSRSAGHLSQSRCRARGDSLCEFVYSTPLERRIPMPRGVPSGDTVAHIGREILQVRDVESVRDAVVTVLRHVLPRDTDASLWSWEEATGQARLLWSCGRPSDRPSHCVVLEASGRTVARLDVDGLPPGQRDEVLGALEGLAPWFAAALGGGGSAPGDPVAEGDPIVRSAARWRLTPRQGDVLRGILDGLTNKEVAARVGCAEATVEVHVTALLRKAGVSTRTGLVSAALVGRAE